MIEIYKRAEDGSLIHIDSSPAPHRASGVLEEDGPRHLKVHPNGRVLYCVTEHCTFYSHSSCEYLNSLCCSELLGRVHNFSTHGEYPGSDICRLAVAHTTTLALGYN
jgi:hypothetical protein